MTAATGYDVSSWQDRLPALAGVGFVIARATYGTRPDDRYVQHARDVRAAGLVLGAYHFGTSATSGRTQAAAFLAAAGVVRPDVLFLDLETERGRVPMSQAAAREFIAAIKATGRPIGLYHSESGFPSLGQSFDWVANWSRQPSRPWLFWQRRGAPLDLDNYAGTLADLRARFGARPANALFRVSFPAGRYRTARVAGGRFLGYGDPFTTGGMSAWVGRPVTLRHGTTTTTWFRLLSGARAGTWCYRFDRRLVWRS